MGREILNSIQHLRAYSVLFVFLFHLEVAGFDWGYVGVDIFFIISGLIISYITYGQEFRFIPFFLRRLKRLFPALLVMFLAIMIAGNWYLLADEYLSVAKTISANFFALSSVYISKTTGYFDIEAAYRPLLHTWSLSIEWICYIVMALGLVVFKGSMVRTLLVIGLGATALISIVGWFIWEENNYYSIAPRLFLFISGYLFWVDKDRGYLSYIKQRKSLILPCLYLVGLPFVLEKHDWPNGYTLLLPIIIYPILLRNSLLFSRPLDVAVSYIGNISYSLYLWHWPIIWIVRVQNEYEKLSLFEQLAAGFFSLLCAIASYHLIEKNSFFVRPRVFALKLILVVAACSLTLAYQGNTAQLMQQLINKNNASQYAKKKMLIHGCPNLIEFVDNVDICTFIGNYKKTIVRADGKTFWDRIEPPITSLSGNSVLVLGDSHSKHFVPILQSSSKIDHVHRLALSIENPDSRQSVNQVFLTEETNYEMLSKHLLAHNISEIYIAYRFYKKTDLALEHFKAFLNKVLEEGKLPPVHITVLRDIPSFNFDPRRCLATTHGGGECNGVIKQAISVTQVLNRDASYWRSIANTFSAYGNISFVDTHLSFCDETDCSVFDANNLIYRDTNHFSERLPEHTNNNLRLKILEKE